MRKSEEAIESLIVQGCRVAESILEFPQAPELINAIARLAETRRANYYDGPRVGYNQATDADQERGIINGLGDTEDRVLQQAKR